jgi:hypothetical protein
MAYVMSARVLDGAGVADVFFDGLRDEVGVGADYVLLVGVVGVGVEQSAEKVGCGLISGG